MCGISGIFSAEHVLSESDREELRAAARRLTHRGPDQQGFIESPHFCAAHNRLSIIDLSTGQQPMVDAESGNVVVFNGEIYNYLELREQLKQRGHRFVTESDTEVVLKGYAQYGEEVLPLLNGMFAFALYDARKRELFVARDRFGEKPLYFMQTDGVFRFASELTALRAFKSCGQGLSQSAVLEYFANGCVAGPVSAVESVSQLMPAMWLKVGAKGLETGCYYRRLKRTTRRISDAEIGDSLAEAIKLRLRADVPVATLLSGGIDSSLITLIAQRHSGRQLHSFAFGWTGGDDELPYARAVAEAAGTAHHEIRLNRLEFAADVDRVVAHMDMPLADSAAFVVFQLAKVIRQNGVKVVLSGDGGDELFGGYDWYRPKSGLKALVKRFGVAEGRRTLDYVAGKCAFARSEMIDAFGADSVAEYFGRVAGEYRQCGPDVEGRIGFDYQRYLPWMLMPKVDRMSMAHAVEIRAPLLDHGLVDTWSQLAGSDKVTADENKVRIKQFCVGSGLLSREFVSRPKMGMNLPLSWWIRSNMDMFLAIVGDSASMARELFGRSSIERWFNEIAQETAAGWTRSAQKVWSCYIFELWRENARARA